MAIGRSITITGKDRPELFRATLLSLLANALEGWRVVIRIEPGPRASEFSAIARELLSGVEHDLPVGAACEGTSYPFLQAAFIDTSVQPIERFLATPVAMTHLDPTPGFPTTCSSNPNSTGQVGRISGAGSHDATDEDLTLSVDLLPTQKIGYFLFSTNQVFVPLFGGSQGNLCVGQPLLRYLPPVLNTGMSGSVQLVVDFDAIPAGASFDPGETWYFQLWYRDTNPGSTSNTTEALVVEFCP